MILLTREYLLRRQNMYIAIDLQVRQYVDCQWKTARRC